MIAGGLTVALVIASLFLDRGFLGWGLIAIAAVMILPTTRSKSLLVMVVPYAGAWFIFTFLRSFADETVLAKTLNTKVANFERWLFGGELPSIRLQDALYSPGNLHWWDFYFTFVHWSYFIVPHAVAFYLWWKHPRLAKQFLGGLILLLSTGLLIYFLIPSNPPWMAPESVNSPGAPVVLRIMEPIGKQLGGGLYQAGYNIVGESNPIAAMPSMHFGVTFFLVWPAFAINRKWFLVMLFYALSMGMGLVYMGEHYVVDITVGAIIATYGWFTAGVWMARVGPVLRQRRERAALSREERPAPQPVSPVAVE